MRTECEASSAAHFFRNLYEHTRGARRCSQGRISLPPCPRRGRRGPPARHLWWGKLAGRCPPWCREAMEPRWLRKRAAPGYRDVLRQQQASRPGAWCHALQETVVDAIASAFVGRARHPSLLSCVKGRLLRARWRSQICIRSFVHPPHLIAGWAGAARAQEAWIRAEQRSFRRAGAAHLLVHSRERGVLVRPCFCCWPAIPPCFLRPLHDH